MATDEGILVTKFKNFCDMPGHSEPAQLVHFVTNCISSFIDADPTDPVGEAGAFLAADAFLDLQRAIDPGTEPTAYAGRPVPILAAEPSARAQIVFKEEKILHSRQIRVLPALQRALHNALPPHFRSAFLLPSGIERLGSPREQWAKLQTLPGPITAEHISQEHAPLVTYYRVGDTLVGFFHIHDSGHRFRAAIKIPYDEFTKRDLAVQALEHCNLFHVSLRHYYDLYPALYDQTYERLKTLILREGARDLAATKQTLSTAHAVTDNNAELVRLRAEIALLKSQAKVRAPTPATDLKNHFCWTCGPQHSHWSKDCPCPAQGHKQFATRHKPMGSAHA